MTISAVPFQVRWEKLPDDFVLEDDPGDHLTNRLAERFLQVLIGFCIIIPTMLFRSKDVSGSSQLVAGKTDRSCSNAEVDKDCHGAADWVESSERACKYDQWVSR